MWMQIYGKVLLVSFLGVALSGSPSTPSTISDADILPDVSYPVAVETATAEPDPEIRSEPLLEPVVDQKELLCLQKNIYYEARGEGMTGMKAIAAVTMNRVNDSRFPNSVCKVVYQRSQFSWTANGGHKVTDKTAWQRAGVIAMRALNGTLNNPIKKAQYFHNRSVRPGWASRMRHVVTIGGHKFFYHPP